MLHLNATGHIYSAQSRNEDVGDSRAQSAITAEKSSLQFTNLGSPINSSVGDTVRYYMDRLESCRGRNTEEKEIKFQEIKKEAAFAIHELHSLRNSTFEYVDEGTNNVYGRLRTGKTEGDRDYYIEKLIEFYQIKTGIENAEDAAGFKASNLFKFHHSSYLFGDMISLERGEPIPDFNYNSGEDQFG
ncbi:NleF caspase inhibitor [Burkholderia ubonensis]|uniref:NleF caspase inhibitor n=1 Tax=Burkholderia ubonensis TaxID=101571 RepID=UPI0009B305E0|nr:NleF caspase inhibitor [Burkholderia ubonensis]